MGTQRVHTVGRGLYGLPRLIRKRHRPLVGISLIGTLPALVFLCLLAAINAAPVSAAPLMVTRFDDPAPDGCLINGCSLREAVIEANAITLGSGSVTTTLLLQEGVYNLTRPIVPSNGAGVFDDDTPATGDLDFIADQFHAGSTTEIVGQGVGKTIIDANFIDRAIDIGQFANVYIEGLSIRNGLGYYANIPGGQGHTHGGAIHVHGSLHMQRATVSDSTATLFQPNGGGIYNAGGATTELTNVTIARNRSVSDGMSVPSGGGIEGGGNVSLNSVTVVNNIAGGLKLNTGSVGYVRNSILANNGLDCTGPIIGLDYSLVQNRDCFPPFEIGNISGNPILAPLSTLAGYTFLYPPITGSPVIDSGDEISCPLTDAYTVLRPQDGNNDTFPVCDMGASEFTRFNVLVTIADKSDNTVSAPVSPGAGNHSFDIARTADFSASSSATHVFLGWEIEHQSYGWAPFMTMTVTGSVEVIARYAPRPQFTDVPPGQQYTDPVHHLAARGLILGYGNGRFGPNDIVNRAQMAALIARATPSDLPAGHTIAPPACLIAATWDCENWGNTFQDRGGLDPNLWRNVGTLQHYGVASGYDGINFGPNDNVTYAQTLSFITRMMIKKGYWTSQPGAPQLFPGVPAGHDLDVRTFAYYAGGEVPNGPGPWSAAQWNSGATRGWFAEALWDAVSTHWGVDFPGKAGFVP